MIFLYARQETFLKYKYLGVYLDRSLTFKRNMESIRMELRSRVNNLSGCIEGQFRNELEELVDWVDCNEPRYEQNSRDKRSRLSTTNSLLIFEARWIESLRHFLRVFTSGLR